MKQVPMEAAEVMAEWWADKIANGARHDNGDHDGLASVFAGILADSMNRPVDDAGRKVFVEKLAKAIHEVENPFRLNHDLYCDYGVSNFMGSIAKEAGINLANFPWKTGMYVQEKDNGSMQVVVRAGYRAEPEIIWSESEEPVLAE